MWIMMTTYYFSISTILSALSPWERAHHWSHNTSAPWKELEDALRPMHRIPHAKGEEQPVCIVQQGELRGLPVKVGLILLTEFTKVFNQLLYTTLYILMITSLYVLIGSELHRVGSFLWLLRNECLPVLTRHRVVLKMFNKRCIREEVLIN